MTVKRIFLLLLLLLQAHFLCALRSRVLSLPTAITGRGGRPRSSVCPCAQREGQIPPSQSPPEIEEQFKEWEEEERELLLEELRDQARSDPDNEGSEDELPTYMLRMIEKFENQQLMVVQEEEQAEKLPSIAVIGRPNTGKSTIVNRLTETYKDGAIVHDEPGITRDRTYRTATHNGYNFQVIDTGGIVFDDTEDVFASKITEQALQGCVVRLYR
jgi:ribosome biogenesis GTPase A